MTTFGCDDIQATRKILRDFIGSHILSSPAVYSSPLKRTLETADGLLSWMFELTESSMDPTVKSCLPVTFLEASLISGYRESLICAAANVENFSEQLHTHPWNRRSTRTEIQRLAPNSTFAPDLDHFDEEHLTFEMQKKSGSPESNGACSTRGCHAVNYALHDAHSKNKSCELLVTPQPCLIPLTIHSCGLCVTQGSPSCSFKDIGS